MSNNNEAAEAEAKAASDAAEAASEAAREAHNATIQANIDRLLDAKGDLSNVDIPTFNNLDAAGDKVWAGNIYDEYKDTISYVNQDMSMLYNDVTAAQAAYENKIRELKREFE